MRKLRRKEGCNNVIITRPAALPGGRRGRPGTGSSTQFKPGNAIGTATRIKPGTRRNPAGPLGRPVSLAQLIRTLSNDGREMVLFMFNIMRGNLDALNIRDPATGRGTMRRISFRDRMAATRWLTDRGFGKVPLLIEISDQPKNLLDLSKLTREEVILLDQLVTKAHIPAIDTEATVLTETAARRLPAGRTED